MRRSRRAGQTDNPRWVQGDHRELPFDAASFDLILNLFSSLGYRGEDGDRRTLAEFARVLRPGAPLVIETMHRDRLAKIYQPRGWEPLPDGGLVVEERRFDRLAGEIETLHTLIPADGERRDFGYRIRCYTATELAVLLRDAGFASIEVFGGWEREELTSDTRLWILART